MVAPSTADGSRATVSAQQSLSGEEGVTLHTFTLPEYRCVRLLVKNLSRGMPESVDLEVVESLTIRVQGVTQLRSGRRQPDLAKDRTPNPHFILLLAQGTEVSKVRSLTELCSLRVSVESYETRKDHYNASASSALDTRRETTDMQHNAWHVGSPTSPVVALPRGNSPCSMATGETTRRTTRGSVKWKEAKAAVAKQAPDRVRMNAATGHTAAPKAQRAGSSAEQIEMGEVWNHVAQGGRIVKATTPLPLFQIPLPAGHGRFRAT